MANDLPSVYWTEKNTGSSGDVYLAYGLTRLLFTLLPEGYDIRIQDEGTAFRLTIIDEEHQESEYLPRSWIENADLPQLLPYIVAGSDEGPFVEGLPVFDLNQQREVSDKYWESRGKLQNQGLRGDDLREALDKANIASPEPEFHLWDSVAKQRAHYALNNCVLIWHAHNSIPTAFLLLLFSTFSAFPTRMDALEEDWCDEIAAILPNPLSYGFSNKWQTRGVSYQTSGQLVTPSAGKGWNFSKAQATSVSENSGQDFWIPQLLRFVGMRDSLIYRAVKPRSKSGTWHAESFVLLPFNITWRRYHAVFNQLESSLRSTTHTQLQVMSILNTHEAFFHQYMVGLPGGRSRRSSRAQPGNYIQAINYTFYQKTSSFSYAVMGMGMLRFPLWLPEPQSREEAAWYQNLIKEHAQLIGRLDEVNTEDYKALQAYHRFLTTSDLTTLCDLYVQLVGIGISRLHAGDRRNIILSLTTLERRVEQMAQTGKISWQLREATEHPGFQILAQALRQATFRPQWDKANLKRKDISSEKQQRHQNEFEPEYGLLQKLLRKAPYPVDFLDELADFVSRYNQETTRKAENPRYSHHPPGEHQRTIVPATALTDFQNMLLDLESNRERVLLCRLLVASGSGWPTYYQNQTDEGPRQTV